MLKEELMNSKDIFENPFENVNANILNAKQIVEYWCSPVDFDEHKFRTCPFPIILQGFRGSGKTTILKYFSYPAQKERADKKGRSLISVITEEKEIGFYYRCDDSFISTFKSIFQNVNYNGWTKIFNNYLELIFCKQILDIYKLLIEQKEINPIQNQEMIKEILNGTPLSDNIFEYNLDCLYNTISAQINYINDYKNRSIFIKENFKPKIILELFTISARIVGQLKKYIPELKNVLFVFLFDEFENLTHDLQKLFNAVIKFTHGDISLRIGRRTEGNITNETINNVEYLSENNDYYLVSLDLAPVQKDGNEFQKYFSEIAQKRFLNMQKNNGVKYDLLTMFGDKENYDDECRDVCRQRDTHLKYILTEDEDIKKDPILCDNIIHIIQNKENPIAETINALWVIRSKEDKLEAAKQVAKTMECFFSKNENINVKKYANDYDNKYRYAITVFLSSVYKKDKLYYSFNTISYLSNGNPRIFINICRTIISYALFFERNKFLETGKISREIQSKAIHNFSKSQFDEICSIMTYGNNIKALIQNLGHIFSALHTDKKVRYPETNQFYFDELSLSEHDREIIKTALSWSVIIKKDKTQRITAGNKKRGILYYFNKVFSPFFNISFRARGGINQDFTSQEIHDMLDNENAYTKIINRIMQKSSTRKKIDTQNDKQLRLF